MLSSEHVARPSSLTPAAEAASSYTWTDLRWLARFVDSYQLTITSRNRRYGGRPRAAITGVPRDIANTPGTS